MKSSTAKFQIGEIVQHKMFGYRGVIYEVDAAFSLSDQWYEQVAKSRPPKDKPWYHVLVDGGQQNTYVAERHLQTCGDTSAIRHPMVEQLFRGIENGRYLSRQTVM